MKLMFSHLGSNASDECERSQIELGPLAERFRYEAVEHNLTALGDCDFEITVFCLGTLVGG